VQSSEKAFAKSSCETHFCVKKITYVQPSCVECGVTGVCREFVAWAKRGVKFIPSLIVRAKQRGRAQNQ
jgi:hypothetical protein